MPWIYAAIESGTCIEALQMLTELHVFVLYSRQQDVIINISSSNSSNSSSNNQHEDSLQGKDGNLSIKTLDNLGELDS